jgi:hypothetical protein
MMLMHTVIWRRTVDLMVEFARVTGRTGLRETVIGAHLVRVNCIFAYNHTMLLTDIHHMI